MNILTHFEFLFLVKFLDILKFSTSSFGKVFWIYYFLILRWNKVFENKADLKFILLVNFLIIWNFSVFLILVNFLRTIYEKKNISGPLLYSSWIRKHVHLPPPEVNLFNVWKIIHLSLGLWGKKCKAHFACLWPWK